MRRISAILFLLKIVKIPISLYSYVLIANFFGVSVQKDMWLLALSLVISLDTAVWGPLNDVFRAKFVTLKETGGENKAINLTQSLLFYMFVFSCLLVAVIYIYPDFFANLISSGYSAVEHEQFIYMLRLVAPILLINQASLIGISILNAYNSFVIPEIASFVSQVINILILLFFVNQLGIYSLVVSTFSSLLILVIFIIYKIKRSNIQIFRFFIPKFSHFKIFFLFALPLFIPYSIGQLNGLIEKKLISSLGTGAVSVIDFSRKFPDMINVIISSIILTVLMPTITKSFVNNDKKEFDKSFLQSFSLGLLILGFFCVFMSVGSRDLMIFFYGNSDIDSVNMSKMVNLNMLYSLAAFAVFLYVIFGMTMLAIGKNKMNAVAGTLTQISIICCNIAFVNLLGEVIFPASLLIAHLLSAVFMFTYYPYDKTKILKNFIRYFLFLFSTGLVLNFLVFQLFHYISESSSFLRILYIIFIQISLFVFSGYFWKITEIQEGINFVKRRVLLR